MAKRGVRLGSALLCAALAASAIAATARAQITIGLPTATRTRVATRTATGTDTPTPPNTPSATVRFTSTVTSTRTASVTRTPTPSETRTRTPTFSGTPTGTRTLTVTRSPTASVTRSPASTATRTDTPTRTRTPTRSITPTPSSTAADSPTATPLAAFASIELIADRAGDNGDGTLTTLIAALISDARGNPVGDGIPVSFSLAPPLSGVTVTQTGVTGALPQCDVSAYIAETGRPVVPRPGTAFTCLRYVRSREGATVSVVAQLVGAGGIVQGRRQVRLPSMGTPVPTDTAAPTATPTASASGTVTMTHTVTESPTGTDTPEATATRTETETPQVTPTSSVTSTVTATGTETPPPTPTVTPSESIRIAAVAGSARPGTATRIRFELTDQHDQVYALQFDALIAVPVFDVFQITTQCRTSPSLTTHQLSATRAFDPPPPVGLFRLRFVLFDSLGAVDHLRAGPLVDCTLPVADDAPLGPSTIVVERMLAGDQNGSLLTGTLTINGTLLVDPDAPLPTPTVTPTDTPTITRTPSASATRTATRTATATSTATDTPTVTATATALPTDTPSPSATPSATATASVSPTPTATVPPCTGDCNGDRRVLVNELILAVRISIGSAAVTDCRAVDRNGNGVVTIDELVAAVGNGTGGCS